MNVIGAPNAHEICRHQGRIAPVELFSKWNMQDFALSISAAIPVVHQFLACFYAPSEHEHTPASIDRDMEQML